MVVAHDPLPLSKPVSVEFLKRITKSQPFLSSMKSGHFPVTAVASTVQGAGIYIYEMENRLCLHSISVPSKKKFNFLSLEMVVAHDPLPLSKPVSVEFLKRITKSQPFLSSMKSGHFPVTAVASTVQGAGIYIYEMENRLCLHSISVPSDVTFTVPATFIPSQNQLNDDSPSGTIYAVPASGSDITCFDSQVWLWNLDLGQPKFNSPFFIYDNKEKITFLSQLDTEAVIVCNTNSSFTLLSSDMKTQLQYINSQNDSIALWTGIKQQDKSSWLLCRIFKLNESLNIIVYSIKKDAKKNFNIIVTFETTEIINENDTPKCFTFNGKQLCILYENLIAKTWNFAKNACAISKINLSQSSIDINSVSIRLLESNYVALLGARKSNGISEMVLTVWDTKYGTLQSEKILENIQVSDKLHLNKSFLDSSFSAKAGHTLFLTTAIITSMKPVRFSTASFTCPLTFNPLTLKTILGKLNSCESSSDLVSVTGMKSILQCDLSDPNWKSNLQEMEKLDESFLSKLTASNETEEDFEKDFQEWIVSKNSIILKNQPSILDGEKKSKSKSKNVKLLVPFSQPCISQLITKMFSNPETFWPRKAIKYVIGTGLVSSAILPEGIMEACLKKADISILQAVCSRISDLKESEWTSLICFALDAKTDSKVLQKKTQDQFLTMAFSAVRNDQFMVQALRKLNMDQVEVLLLWLESIIIPVGKKNYWWVWGSFEETEPSIYEKDIVHWRLAVEALSLVIDAHMVNIIMTSNLIPIMERINVIIGDESEFYGTLYERVAGLLKPFTKISKNESTKGQSKKGKRWREMLENAQDDCGAYSIEVLAI